MAYIELRSIVLGLIPDLDSCSDCGDILHFYKKVPSMKGHDIAIDKRTGKTLPFVLCIENGMVTKCVQLDFETGEPKREDEE